MNLLGKIIVLLALFAMPAVSLGAFECFTDAQEISGEKPVTDCPNDEIAFLSDGYFVATYMESDYDSFVVAGVVDSGGIVTIGTPVQLTWTGTDIMDVRQLKRMSSNTFIIGLKDYGTSATSHFGHGAVIAGEVNLVSLTITLGDAHTFQGQYCTDTDADPDVVYPPDICHSDADCSGDLECEYGWDEETGDGYTHLAGFEITPITSTKFVVTYSSYDYHGSRARIGTLDANEDVTFVSFIDMLEEFDGGGDHVHLWDGFYHAVGVIDSTHLLWIPVRSSLTGYPHGLILTHSGSSISVGDIHDMVDVASGVSNVKLLPTGTNQFLYVYNKEDDTGTRDEGIYASVVDVTLTPTVSITCSTPVAVYDDASIAFYDVVPVGTDNDEFVVLYRNSSYGFEVRTIEVNSGTSTATCPSAATTITGFYPTRLMSFDDNERFAMRDCTDNDDTNLYVDVECPSAPLHYSQSGEECDAQNPCQFDGDGSECINGTCYTKMNRYLGIEPNPANDGINRAIRIQWTDGTNGPATIGWVGTPDIDGRSVLVANPVYGDWDDTIFVTGCAISPDEDENYVYSVQVVFQGTSTYSDALELTTTPLWADIVGTDQDENDIWEPPNGVVNLTDMIALGDAFGSPVPDHPIFPRADLVYIGTANEDDVPNRVVNLSDITKMGDAISNPGLSFPCNSPCECESPIDISCD